MKLTRMSTWSAEASSRRISCSSDGEPLPAVNSQGRVDFLVDPDPARLTAGY
jgi:hypothetical protein